MRGFFAKYRLAAWVRVSGPSEQRVPGMAYATIMVQVDGEGELNGRVRLAIQLADRFQSRLIGVSSWTPRPPLVAVGVSSWPPRPPLVAEGMVIDLELTPEDIARKMAALNKRGDAFKAAAGTQWPAG